VQLQATIQFRLRSFAVDGVVGGDVFHGFVERQAAPIP
jgi:hypothetical protein